eukprot:2152521-Amphidinium_carterae.1
MSKDSFLLKPVTYASLAGEHADLGKRACECCGRIWSQSSPRDNMPMSVVTRCGSTLRSGS